AGRDETGKDRALRIDARYFHDIRQDAGQPSHFQVQTFGEHAVHGDAEVNRMTARRAVAQLVVFRHRSILESQLQRERRRLGSLLDFHASYYLSSLPLQQRTIPGRLAPTTFEPMMTQSP